MQLTLTNATVELSGESILENINIEVNTGDKVGIIGRNGCGKTTLLKAIYGTYDVIPASSKSVTSGTVIGMLDQMTFEDESRTLLDEILTAYSHITELKEKLDASLLKMENDQSEENIKEYTLLLDMFTNAGGFYFEKEYEAALSRFGFSKEDKSKKLSEFSGGQRTKIAFLRLLLSKPDILLLDEPTNHLDVGAISWLESYIREYKKAVITVSHDRMFLDNTVNRIYDIENKKAHYYAGNYSFFAEEKKKRQALALKKYEAQQEEIKRLNDLAERFRYKATKAKMAQSKLKQIERMDILDAPEKSDTRTFNFNLSPRYKSSETALTVRNLEIGFDKALAVLNFTVQRGDRIGIIGQNGIGKSTLLKTLTGSVKKISGEFLFGEQVDIGYFDQQMAHFKGGISVLDDFFSSYPYFTEFEARSILGRFLFTGEEVFKTLDMLSGGEKVRLALCKLFIKQPNFLILDEPTNHMDIESKEALEDILSEYGGTMLFVSHDRYFIKKLSNKLLDFEPDGSRFYEYGYSQYLSSQTESVPEEAPVNVKKEKKEKSNYVTPGKLKARKERAISKLEQEIEQAEKEAEELKGQLNDEKNISDYVLLQELSSKLELNQQKLFKLMEEWERLCEE